MSYQLAQAAVTSWLLWKRVGSHGGGALVVGQEPGLTEVADGLGGPEACCFVSPHEGAAGSVELALGRNFHVPVVLARTGVEVFRLQSLAEALVDLHE